MARKKSYSKRKKYSRYPRRKSISRVPRQLATKSTGFRLSMTAPVACTAVSNTIAFRMSLTNPNRGMVFNQFNGGTYTAMTEWADITNLYDQYRVTYVKIKFIPSAPNSTANLFLPLYIFHDFDDDDTTDATVAQAITDGSCRIKNMYKPWTYKMRVTRKYSSGGGGSAPIGGGWFDTAAPPVIGCVKAIATGMTSANYGYLICNMWVKCRDRR